MALGAMRRFHGLFLAIWGLAPLLWGHVDPRGENNPEVVVEGGRFVLYTREWESSGTGPEGGSGLTVRREAFAPDGTLVEAKHVVTDDAVLKRLGLRPDGRLTEGGTRIEYKREALEKGSAVKPEAGSLEDPFAKSARDFVGESVKPRVLVMRTMSNGRIDEAPLPVTESDGQLEESLVTSGGLGLLLSAFPDPPPTADDLRILNLRLMWLDGPHFSSQKVVPLSSRVASIYDFAVTSALVKADDRVVVAWVEAVDGIDAQPPTKKWVTVVASWSPATGAMECEVLREQSHWNSPPSLAVLDGRLCLAWHCSKDGSYPGDAQIMKVFRKLPLKATPEPPR